jgi:hypothetical protein
MTEQEIQAHKTLRYSGIICRCDDCDIFGCTDCILCKISDKDAIEIAKKLEDIANS